jgi:hypothetical protein
MFIYGLLISRTIPLRITILLVRDGTGFSSDSGQIDRSDGWIDLVFAIRGGCYELARFGFLFELVWSIAVVSWHMALINLTFVSLHV